MDDRFGSMMGYGTNTNDADATASDVAKGKTAYAKGSKLVGTAEFGGGGVDLDSLGSKVSVEAQESVSVGDRFVGEANTSGVASKIVSTSIGVTFNAISDDNSVGIVNQTLNEGNNQLKIYFLNDEGAYEPEVFEISQSKISNIMTYLGTTSVPLTRLSINETGTLVCTTMSNGTNRWIIIALLINKGNKTLNFNVYYSPSIDYQPVNTAYTYKNDWVVTTASPTFTVVGNYIHLINVLIKGTAIKISDGSEVATTKYVGIWYRCRNNCTQYACGNWDSKEGYLRRTRSDGIILEVYTYYKDGSYGAYTVRIKKYIDSGDALTYSSSRDFDANVSGPQKAYSLKIWLSNNGKYIGIGRDAGSYKKATYFLSLDISTMTISQLYTTSKDSYDVVPTDSGTLWWYSKTSNEFPQTSSYSAGIYELEDGTLTPKYAGGALPTNGKLDIDRWISGSTAYNVSPSSNASYLIKKMNVMTTESGKIYGVCNENIATGFTGTAIKMFST